MKTPPSQATVRRGRGPAPMAAIHFGSLTDGMAAVLREAGIFARLRRFFGGPDGARATRS
jgi:hypothetical protein